MKKNLKTPTVLKRRRTHGFLRRMRTKSGRALLRRRREKGRDRLCVS